MYAKSVATQEQTLLTNFLKHVGVQLYIKRNTFLYHQLDKASSFYYISSGKFVISRETAEGKQLYLSYVTEGDIIGDLSLFEKNAVQCFSAKALENSEVYVIEKKQIEKVFFEEKEIAMELIKSHNLYNKINESKFRDLVLCGKKGAVYSTIIRMTNTYGVKMNTGILVDFKYTLGDIANFSGTTREGVTRLFSDLKKENIIDIVDGKILVLDLDYLRNEIDCERCPVQYCQL
jgi:CRP/FNR family transcriptional regulator